MATQQAKTMPSADWRVIFLQDIQAPVTKNNLFLLDLWARFEGGMSHNNPLNTTLNTAHVTGTWNSSGVKNYDTLANGAHAAAQTLLNSRYSSIVTAFRKNEGAPTIAARIEQSPWDAGHYNSYKNGRYVGGTLFKAALGPGGHSPSLIGELGHYAIHPGAGVETSAGAAQKALEKPLTDTLHYILYGLAIAGGGALVITGFVLIAADIGLEKARGSRAARYGSGAVGQLRGSSSGSDDDAEGAYREHRNNEAEARARRAQARATIEEAKVKSLRQRQRESRQTKIPF